MFEGTVYGVSTFVGSAGFVGEVLPFPCRVRVILPCRETACGVMLKYFSIRNLIKCTVKLGEANAGMGSAIYNKSRYLQPVFIFVITK